MRFLILFAQTNESFRVAELQALADMYKINIDLGGYDSDSPFLVVELPDVATAIRLIERSILCRSIYELYSQGETLDLLHDNIKESYDEVFWSKYRQCSFKFDIVSFQGSKKKQEQVDIIESFDYLDMQGPIRMKNADEIFAVLEQYEKTSYIGQVPALSMIYFGRHVYDSSRKLIETYDLKKRKYIGTTSFEAELALVTCNIAQCDFGKIAYDPFVGTASFLVCASEFGSLTMGSDIDSRTMKGKNTKCNIFTNFKQYGTSSRFIDSFTMDFTHNALRHSLKLDAIICDPPYGVREGLKVLGTKLDSQAEEQKLAEIDGVPAYLVEGYIPPKQPYAFSQLLRDLLEFSAQRLAKDGRLVFWMPTANEDMQQNVIPQHSKLVLVASCVQEFGKWSRLLLAYKRRKDCGEETYACEREEKMMNEPMEEKVMNKPMEEFRDKYFRGFRNV